LHNDQTRLQTEVRNTQVAEEMAPPVAERPQPRSLVRPSYYLDGDQRPLHRGAMVACFHRHSDWAVACLLYIVVGTAIGGREHAAGSVLRVLLVLATLYNLAASDWLHNLDQNVPVPLSAMEMKRVEWTYYRHDLVSISSILTSSFGLWAYNLDWQSGLDYGFGASCLCTALVALIATYGMAESSLKAANPILVAKPFVTIVRLIFFVQFFCLLLYESRIAHHSDLDFCFLIWLVYMPGFLCYAIKPAVTRFEFAFGAHEFFHVFVFSGHVASFTCDLLARAHRVHHPSVFGVP